MVKIKSDTVFEKISELLVEINTKIKPEIKEFFKDYEGPFKKEIIENFEIASKEYLPLCQDTGMVEFFVFKGFNVLLDKPIEYILDEAVKDVYERFGFRKSVVSDPLFSRVNTRTNTPCVVHLFEIEENKLEIWTIAKGGGSENLSALYMFNPSESYEAISQKIFEHIKQNGPNACPPIKVGVGVGGTSDKAVMLSKLALFDYDASVYLKNVIRYQEAEEKLMERLNEIKFGVQGLGYGKGIYNVKMYGFPTHIATLPVAISVDCYLLRSGRVVFENE
ncbi:fumarate hydratase [Fervidobacterium sp. 2310opik-2]|uniref:fumarate hydratase n=1 Tax=Fervidobacterium sp. 2310opik-2 TaxID=1755815 RepID=UPI0013E0606B|nr:fumarate hydratase [Fervidobacterium sp. 2310opik-2]KAF2960961.1 fumarate hydratase [Fervidobacterium sp. 2310opik-2]